MTKIQKQAELCCDKAKTIYSTENPDLLVLEFRNDMSAGGGTRIEQSDRKGMVNNKFNYFITNKPAEVDIPTQMECLLFGTERLMKKLDMVPAEYIAHNRVAGSLMKRLGTEEGIELSPPLLDLLLKNDAMHDSMINESYCEAFDWVSRGNPMHMKELTYKTNDALEKLFNDAGLILVDFRLEFGLHKGEVVLGDELSPDGSRLWDKETLEKVDRDCFRQSLGGLIETYETVACRLGIQLGWFFWLLVSLAEGYSG